MMTTRPRAVAARADRQPQVQVEGETVGGALGALARQHAALEHPLVDDDGELRATQSLFLNGGLLRPDSANQPVQSGDELEIVTAVVGG